MIRAIVRCGALIALVSASIVAQTFTDVTVASGILVPPYAPVPSSYVQLGRGCAWADFDGDGDQDVFTVGGPGGDYVLWTNTAGTFSSSVVLAASTSVHHDHQTLAADFDNDGDADVYVVRGNFLPNLLFVNQGNGTFVEEGALRGVADAGDGFAASFGDVDRDGYLDLYVGNYLTPNLTPATNVLYRNLGNGTFADVTTAAGVPGVGLALAVLMHDVDEDGWPDIIVGNDKGAFLSPSQIYRNDRDGTFTDVSVAWNAAMQTDCMGLTVGDVDGDGYFDLFSTDVPLGQTLMLWDATTGTFKAQPNWEAEALAWGFTAISDGWSCFLRDFDHDQRIDLFYTQGGASGQLFGNSASPPYNNLTVASGLAAICPPAFCSTIVDYDDDGDLDIFLPGDGLPSRMLRNDLANGSNYLKIALTGTISNRDGIGASVRVRTGMTVRRQVRISGEGYLSDSDPRLHFGVGTEVLVDEIEIRWPSGTVQYLAQVPVNQVLSVTEPQFQITGTLAPGTASSVALSLPDDAFLPYVCGLTGNVFTQYELGDGRAVLTDVTDPLLALTTIPGNSGFVNSVGFFDAQGLASMTLNIPPVPALSGFGCWMIGVSWNPLYASNIKSIVGPQRIVIP